MHGRTCKQVWAHRAPVGKSRMCGKSPQRPWLPNSQVWSQPVSCSRLLYIICLYTVKCLGSVLELEVAALVWHTVAVRGLTALHWTLRIVQFSLWVSCRPAGSDIGCGCFYQKFTASTCRFHNLTDLRWLLLSVMCFWLGRPRIVNYCLVLLVNSLLCGEFLS